MPVFKDDTLSIDMPVLENGLFLRMNPALSTCPSLKMPVFKDEPRSIGIPVLENGYI